MFTGMGFLCW